jgi:FHS family L-fucose permease-like MFS transporter
VALRFDSHDNGCMAGGVPVAANVSRTPTGADKTYVLPLVALTSLFFIWGFITCLNDILIPHLKAIFKLNYFQAMFIQFAFFIAYAVMSIPSGGLTKRFGYKRSIVIGLTTMATGCVLFYPAAAQRSYPIFLVALFVLASGITLLQVSANPFVAILGKPETASSRLTMTQAFNAVGTTIAPQFGSMLILATAVKGAEELVKLTPAEAEAYRIAEASSVQTPYLAIAAALVLLAILFARFKLPTVTADEGEGTPTDVANDRGSAWRYPRLVFGALAIFMYVGGEVSIGSL